MSCNWVWATGTDIYGNSGILSLKGKVTEDSALAFKQTKKDKRLLCQDMVFSQKKMLVLDIPGLSVCHRHSTGTGTEDPDLINWLSVQGADEATINKVRRVLPVCLVTQMSQIIKIIFLKSTVFVTECKKITNHFNYFSNFER